MEEKSLNEMSAQHTPGPLPFQREPRNPFRQVSRRRAFDGMVAEYKARHRNLFHRASNTENRLNNIGESFWRGFHGERYIWDKDAPLYVAYRAGAAIAKALGSKA